jgi:hypothetical protein
VALIIAAGLVLSGCAAPPAPNDRLKSVALITSGHTMSLAFAGAVPEIVIVDVDGSPTDKPYGPIELAPGPHAVTMKCGDALRLNNLTVKAGEIYQFNKVVAAGGKGCTATLSRMRSAYR